MDACLFDPVNQLSGSRNNCTVITKQEQLLLLSSNSGTIITVTV